MAASAVALSFVIPASHRAKITGASLRLPPRYAGRALKHLFMTSA
jgi:hypothetical protein